MDTDRMVRGLMARADKHGRRAEWAARDRIAAALAYLSRRLDRSIAALDAELAAAAEHAARREEQRAAFRLLAGVV